MNLDRFQGKIYVTSFKGFESDNRVNLRVKYIKFYERFADMIIFFNRLKYKIYILPW